MNFKDQTCIIIGASHAGVNCAFALRKEGWEGKIVLIDNDPNLPYHRPPLSKTFLTSDVGDDIAVLKSEQSYEDAGIDMKLGTKVVNLNAKVKQVVLENGNKISYDKLVLATGASAFMPPFNGLEKAKNVFTLRNSSDALSIRSTYQSLDQKRVVIIGGGFIGLECAASLRKMGAEVIVIEKEERLLSRVTAPEISSFFVKLHSENGIAIHTSKTVLAIQPNGNSNEVICDDGSSFAADMIIVGVGIRVNTDLAHQAGLEPKNGITVNHQARTSNEYIYAIGDCSYHFNPHYKCYLRLESVQNAVDQAKIAASSICNNDVTYDSIPWFWSDQFDVKLQMVGLSNGYKEVVIRKEEGKDKCLSVWYFKDDQLLAVDAANNAKAYMLGTRFIKQGVKIDKIKLADPEVAFKPANFIIE